MAGGTEEKLTVQ